MEKLFENGALYLFLTFFIPGFIALKVYDLLVPNERRDFTKSIFDAVAYSAIFFVLLFPVTAILLSVRFQAAYPIWWVILWFILFLLVPVFAPFLIRWLLTEGYLRRWLPHPEPRAWDYVFGKRERAWMIVHLKDLRKIGGLFAFRSFASSHPSAEPQIYLEEVWKLGEQGEFLEKVPQSSGILIRGSEILAVQFFSYNDVVDDQ